METNRKGLCINVGNCKNADSKVPIELSIAADFVCPECGRELIPIGEKKKFQLSVPMIVAALVALLLLGGGGYGYYMYKRAKAVVDVAKSTVEDVSKIVNDTMVTQSVKNVAQDVSSTANPAKDVSSDQKINSIQDYFDRLSDNSAYGTKSQIQKAGIDQLFVNGEVKVITLGKNQTETADASISDFAESLRVSNQHYKFVRGEKQGSKFSKIYVTAE